MDVDVEPLESWLPAHAGQGPLVTMLPDANDLGLSIELWAAWFSEAVELCLESSSGPTVFAQCDRLHDGAWLDKAKLVEDEAWRLRRYLLWHKIGLRRGLGKVDLHRPTYIHLLAFGPGRPGKRRPDVIDAGPRWSHSGVGVQAAKLVASFLAETAPGSTVLNPAAGFGTFCWAALEEGLSAKACDIARQGDWWSSEESLPLGQESSP